MESLKASNSTCAAQRRLSHPNRRNLILTTDEGRRMPELPEVETIVRGLRRSVVGKTIASTDVRLARMVVAPPGVEFARAISGSRIVATGRRGKYAVLEFDSGRSL